MYGSLLTWPDGKAMIYDTLLADGSMGGHEVKPETIGQFTGLFRCAAKLETAGSELYWSDEASQGYTNGAKNA